MCVTVSIASNCTSKISVALGGMMRLIARLAVGQFGRDAQLALAADFHAGDTFVPSLDDVALAQREVVGLVRVDGAVELLAGGEPSGVVDLDMVAVLGGRRRVPTLMSQYCRPDSVLTPSPVTLVGAFVLGRTT